jgi:PPOX class probable F420-dependent enzyme
MDTPTTPTTPRAPERVAHFLRTEEVLWLSTFGTDGFPGLVPIWFSWDGDAILVVSKPHAEKVEDMRAQPRVMVALGDAEKDFDVGLIEARAELLDTPVDRFLPESHWAKYAADLASIGLTREEYVRTYSQAVRLVPVRYLGWHGRSEPASARPARRQKGRRPTCRVTMPRVSGSQRTSSRPASRMIPAMRAGSG